MNSKEREKDMTLEDEPPCQKVSIMLLGKNGGQLLTATGSIKWLGQSGNDTQLWMCLLVNLVLCCNEQFCLETWNVRSRNQGKLDMVKQERHYG